MLIHPKTPFREQFTRDYCVNTYIGLDLLKKIWDIEKKKGFKSRSKTIRGLIMWFFENQLEDQIQVDGPDLERNMSGSIIFRLDEDLVNKLDTLKKQKGFATRSKTVRKILSCTFENGVDS